MFKFLDDQTERGIVLSMCREKNSLSNATATKRPIRVVPQRKNDKKICSLIFYFFPYIFKHNR